MEMKEPMEGLHFVGKKDDLIKSKRSFRTLEGRDILLVYHQGILYALDYHCYREYQITNNIVSSNQSFSVHRVAPE